MNYLQKFRGEFRSAFRAEGMCIPSVEFTEGSIVLYTSSLGSTILKHGITGLLGFLGGGSVIGLTLLGDSILGEDHHNQRYAYFSRQFPRAFGYDLSRALRSLYTGVRYLPRLFIGDEAGKMELRKKAGISFATSFPAELIGLTPITLLGDVTLHRLIENKDLESAGLAALAYVFSWIFGTTIIAGLKPFVEGKYNQMLNSK